MSIESLLTKWCTIITREKVGTDEYGNPTLTETGRRRARCYIELGGFGTGLSTSEQAVDRATTSDDWVLFLAGDDPIGPTDQVEFGDWPDGTFEVFGKPSPLMHPRRKKIHHLEVRLRRTI